MKSPVRRRTVALVTCAAAVLVGSTVLSATAAGAPRIDLRVLVLTDRTPWVDAINSQLASEGVPTTVMDLTSATRAPITDAVLSGALGDGTPWAKFQAVVLPNEAPAGLTPAEGAALLAFEKAFGIREVNSYVDPTYAVGLTASFAGVLDGLTAHATPAAKADAFRYLQGPVRFEDRDPTINEAYGYLAEPLPDDPLTGAHFEPFVTAEVPNRPGVQRALVGVYRKDGREQMVLNFAYNYAQAQFKVLVHGVVGWMTKGVHLGYWRNYLSVHVDDVLGDDLRWSEFGKCTPGDNDCPPGVEDTVPIRMTPADVDATLAWQQANAFRFSMLYNAKGGIDAGTPDALTDRLLAAKDRFWWVNHTYSHRFLGCVQDFTVIPWRCQRDEPGNVLYEPRTTIAYEVQQNIDWAQRNGLPIDASELVNGEYSGTARLPQQPADNPNLAPELTNRNIRSLGVDASRELGQRMVGSALTMPRHPINVFYNVGSAAEEVSEYNWLYTSRADGGSGFCEDNSTNATCIDPLDPETGWQNYIRPMQTAIMFGSVTSNDPRPYFVHQSNLAEDRLALQPVGDLLSTYRSIFAANAPVVDQRMAAATTALKNQTTWTQTRAADTVTAYAQGASVVVRGPRNTSVPVTAPAGTQVNGAAVGESYGGEQSGYLALGVDGVSLTLPKQLTLPLPTSPSPARRTTASTPTRDTGTLPRTTDGNVVTPTDPTGIHILPKLGDSEVRPLGPPAAVSSH